MIDTIVASTEAIHAALGDALLDAGFTSSGGGWYHIDCPEVSRGVHLPTLTSDERRFLWGWFATRHDDGSPRARAVRHLVNLCAERADRMPF